MSTLFHSYGALGGRGVLVTTAADRHAALAVAWILPTANAVSLIPSQKITTILFPVSLIPSQKITPILFTGSLIPSQENNSNIIPG